MINFAQSKQLPKAIKLLEIFGPLFKLRSRPSLKLNHSYTKNKCEIKPQLHEINVKSLNHFSYHRTFNRGSLHRTFNILLSTLKILSTLNIERALTLHQVQQTHSTITCSMLIKQTLEQAVKYNLT